MRDEFDPAVLDKKPKPDGGPAFPVPDGRSWGVTPSKGMSLRDYFAGQVITLFPLTPENLDNLKTGCRPQHEVVASFCYALADAMLAERAK